MAKRSVPSTILIRCQDLQYAEGLKDGIVCALENLMHECDIIMRLMPTVEIYSQKENLQYCVRARFSVREKLPHKEEGEWIEISEAYYEQKLKEANA
jgi:hypothetical protein